MIDNDESSSRDLIAGSSQLIEFTIKLIWQIVRFGIVGLTAAAIHFCCVVTLVHQYELQPLIANIFAFFIAFQVSYWGHRLWTFSATRVLHKIAFPKLLVVQLIALAASEMLYYIFLSLNFTYPVALLFVLIILPVFTFISNKLWVFR